MSAKKVRVSEQAVQAEILKGLSFLPDVFAFRTPVRGVFDPKRKAFRKSDAIKGMPDIIGVLANHGQIFAIEVKTPHRPKKGTPEQEHFLQLIRSYGGKAGVARSYQEALEIIRGD